MCCWQAEARIAAALATNAAQLRERRAAFDARQTHNEERRRSERMTIVGMLLQMSWPASIALGTRLTAQLVPAIYNTWQRQSVYALRQTNKCLPVL